MLFLSIIKCLSTFLRADSSKKKESRNTKNHSKIPYSEALKLNRDNVVE